MVEKIELAIIFISRNVSNTITEFTPLKVIEGTYDKNNNWFNDSKDGLIYLHVDIPAPNNVYYACRTTIEVMKDSLSENSIEQIKKEMLDYAQKFTYKRDISKNDYIVAQNKETGDETLFEDVDNTPKYIRENSSLNYSGDNEILLMTPKDIEEQVKKLSKDKMKL